MSTTLEVCRILENKLDARFNIMLDRMESAQQSFRFTGIVRPQIRVITKDLCTVVARASYIRSEKIGLVEFSTCYFNQLLNKKDTFKTVCVHELAHVIQLMYYPHSQPHSRVWRTIMWFNGYVNPHFNCPEIARMSRAEKREMQWKTAFAK